jgi:hypothetical protein
MMETLVVRNDEAVGSIPASEFRPSTVVSNECSYGRTLELTFQTHRIMIMRQLALREPNHADLSNPVAAKVRIRASSR